MVQWLGLHVFTAGGAGSIPAQGTKIPQAAGCSQEKKKKKKKNFAKLLTPRPGKGLLLVRGQKNAICLKNNLALCIRGVRNVLYSLIQELHIQESNLRKY